MNKALAQKMFVGFIAIVAIVSSGILVYLYTRDNTLSDSNKLGSNSVSTEISTTTAEDAQVLEELYNETVATIEEKSNGETTPETSTETIVPEVATVVTTTPAETVAPQQPAQKTPAQIANDIALAKSKVKLEWTDQTPYIVKNSGKYVPIYDFTKDGVQNILDFSIFKATLGLQCSNEEPKIGLVGNNIFDYNWSAFPDFDFNCVIDTLDFEKWKLGYGGYVGDSSYTVYSWYKVSNVLDENLMPYSWVSDLKIRSVIYDQLNNVIKDETVPFLYEVTAMGGDLAIYQQSLPLGLEVYLIDSTTNQYLGHADLRVVGNELSLWP